MNVISTNIEEHFFEVWLNEDQLPNFEKWVYESTELKDTLSTDSYYELLSFNYKSDNAYRCMDRL